MKKSEPIQLAANVNLYVMPCSIFKTTRIAFFIPSELDSDYSYNALIPAVLRRGCKSYPDQKSIEILTQELYGASLSSGVRKYQSKQVLYFTINFVDGQYLSSGEDLTDKVLGFMYELMNEPVTENGKFRTEYVRQEAFNQKQYVLSLVNDKDAFARQRLLEEMAPGKPFTKCAYGDSKELDNIDEKHLFEVYKRLISENPVDIFVVGDIEPDIIKEKLSSRFRFSDRKALLPFTPEIVRPESVKTREEVMNVKQGRLNIGFRSDIAVSDKEFFDLVMFNAVLGGNVNSKLFTNVREKASLCYNIWSSYDRFTNILTIATGIDCKNRDKAYDIIMEQIKAIADSDISDFEFEASMKDVITRTRTVSDSALSMIFYRYADIMAGVDYPPDEYISKVSSVRKEALPAIASRIYEDTVYFLKG